MPFNQRSNSALLEHVAAPETRSPSIAEPSRRREDLHPDQSGSDQHQHQGDLLASCMPVKEARSVLDLPEGVELTKKAINDADKSLARVHHPEAGGDASKFQRIAEAKDRLMLVLAA